MDRDEFEQTFIDLIEESKIEIWENENGND